MDGSVCNLLLGGAGKGEGGHPKSREFCIREGGGGVGNTNLRRLRTIKKR